MKSASVVFYSPKPWHLRGSIDPVPLATGVLGTNHFNYDSRGCAMNSRARLEQSREAGKINDRCPGFYTNYNFIQYTPSRYS